MGVLVQIVFFNTSCLTTLALSPLNRSLTHLRLRIPQRDVSTPLSLPTHLISPHPLTQQPFPSLRYLDLSTSNIRLNTHLPSLLRTYPFLEHLVMDHTNLFGFLGREREKGRELCRELGRLVGGLAGMSRSREVERAITRWEEEEAKKRERERRWREEGERENDEDDDEEGGQGRRGPIDEAVDQLAALTTEEYNPTVGRSRRRQARPMNMSTFTIRSSSTAASGSATAGSSSARTTATHHAAIDGPAPPPNTIAFVLPPIPTLRSLSLGGETPRPLPASERRQWINEFQAGWKEGAERLVKWAIEGVGIRFERARRKAETERWEWERRGGVGLSSIPDGSSTTNANASSMVTGNGKAAHASSHHHHHPKGKGRARSSSSAGTAAASSSSSSSQHPSTSTASSQNHLYPPPKVILYRFPTSHDPLPSLSDLSELTTSSSPASLLKLIPIDLETDDWRSRYTDLLLPPPPISSYPPHPTSSSSSLANSHGGFPTSSPGVNVADDVEGPERIDVWCVFCPVAEDSRGGPLRRGEDTKLGAGSGYITPARQPSSSSTSTTTTASPSGAGTPRTDVSSSSTSRLLEDEQTLAELARGGHAEGCGHAFSRHVWGE